MAVRKRRQYLFLSGSGAREEAVSIPEVTWIATEAVSIPVRIWSS
jgi:hypothetical protein